MKMEPIRSSETSAIKTQTPGNYPKRNVLQLKHGESLKTTTLILNARLQGAQSSAAEDAKTAIMNVLIKNTYNNS